MKVFRPRTKATKRRFARVKRTIDCTFRARASIATGLAIGI